jgi:hypothetical protein
MVSNPTGYETINAFEIAVVERPEGFRIVCRSLNEFGIVRPAGP